MGVISTMVGAGRRVKKKTFSHQNASSPNNGRHQHFGNKKSSISVLTKALLPLKAVIETLVFV